MLKVVGPSLHPSLLPRALALLPALRATRDGSPLATAVRLFLLAEAQRR